MEVREDRVLRKMGWGSKDWRHKKGNLKIKGEKLRVGSMNEKNSQKQPRRIGIYNREC